MQDAGRFFPGIPKSSIAPAQDRLSMIELPKSPCVTSLIGSSTPSLPAGGPTVLRQFSRQVLGANCPEKPKHLRLKHLRQLPGL